MLSRSVPFAMAMESDSANEIESLSPSSDSDEPMAAVRGRGAGASLHPPPPANPPVPKAKAKAKAKPKAGPKARPKAAARRRGQSQPDEFHDTILFIDPPFVNVGEWKTAYTDCKGEFFAMKRLGKEGGTSFYRWMKTCMQQKGWHVRQRTTVYRASKNPAFHRRLGSESER